MELEAILAVTGAAAKTARSWGATTIGCGTLAEPLSPDFAADRVCGDGTVPQDACHWTTESGTQQQPKLGNRPDLWTRIPVTWQ